ncbi:MAG TPA: DUF2793 domain-containing protein [Thermohalobaculum sp.]|nr:DUF2793 domain-containing protein [Thermohalobaculum sp.]
MSNSPRIGLPYLDAAQAQKHVTMNEALARLDMAAAGRAETMSLASPPASPVEGDAHIVPAGADGAWAGEDGNVAVYLNGGWDFVTPWAGWSLWVASDTGVAVFDGTEWRLTSQPTAPGGAFTLLRQVEIDHAVGAGATSQTAAFIPDKAIVLGVTARVVAEIGGATTWALGVSGSPDRYGTGIGVGLNSHVEGVTSSPLAYYGGSSLLLTAGGGDFTGGSVRIAAHYFQLSAPRSV